MSNSTVGFPSMVGVVAAGLQVVVRQVPTGGNTCHRSWWQSENGDLNGSTCAILGLDSWTSLSCLQRAGGARPSFAPPCAFRACICSRLCVRDGPIIDATAEVLLVHMTCGMIRVVCIDWVGPMGAFSDFSYRGSNGQVSQRCRRIGLQVQYRLIDKTFSIRPGPNFGRKPAKHRPKLTCS
jgi:hypothetical protein